VALVAAALLGLATQAESRVTLVASRAESLYSIAGTPDCTDLSQRPDAELPMNVVRIRAVVDGAPTDGVRYQWTMVGKQLGTLAADQPVGDGEQIPAVQGVCAEFGNACVLTEDKLRFYAQPTILWLAPSCEKLTDKKTRTPGGIDKLRVAVTLGRRRLGKAIVSLAYGRVASVRLYADGQDGGTQNQPISTGFRVLFSAATASQIPLPPLQAFEFDNGGGALAGGEGGCRLDGVAFESCAGARGELDYASPGRFRARVEERFEDGSALCDDLQVNVLACSGDGKVDVQRSPRLGTYVPGDARRGTVGVRVRFRNTSQRRGGLPPCTFLLGGSNVLSAVEELEIGGTTDTKTTRFDLPHCSRTDSIGCTSDEQCRPPICSDCQGGESCLTQSHCSKTVAQACSHDADCAAPACSACEDQETCIHVLALHAPAVLLRPGESVELFDESVPLQNLLPDTARMSDTWTVSTENGFVGETTDRYRIRGTR
jgi:hypothetical protein